MSEYVIEKGIPLPLVARGVIRALDVGDSFLTTRPVQNFANEAKHLGVKLASRKQPDGQIRIWRVA